VELKYKRKSLFLLGAIIAGIVIPRAESLSFLIYYLLMFILFFSSSPWKLSPKILMEKRVYLVLLANLVIGMSGYLLLKNYNESLALTAFIIGITPTATACPAVMGFLKGRVDFAISEVIVTNISMELFIPFAFLKISDMEIEIHSMLLRTLILIFIPLIVGQIMNRLLPELQKKISAFSGLGFYAWLLVCFFAVARASHFIRESSTDANQIILSAVLAAMICILNFILGYFLGGGDLSLETSQTLGQKNTSLTIWVALTYLSPAVALVPTFYLICHNLYNSFQLAYSKV